MRRSRNSTFRRMGVNGTGPEIQGSPFLPLKMAVPKDEGSKFPFFKANPSPQLDPSVAMTPVPGEVGEEFNGRVNS